MYSDFVEQELRPLEKRVALAQEWLDKYQARLDFLDDPRDSISSKHAVKQIKESANGYIRGYTSLNAQLHTTATPSRLLEEQLDRIETDVNIFKDGQTVILSQLDHTRQELLSRYDISQQRLMVKLVQQLEQSQLKLAQSLLNFLENQRLPEIEIGDLWQLVKQSLAKRYPEQVQIAQIIEDSRLKLKHRLKISVSLIPTIFG